MENRQKIPVPRRSFLWSLNQTSGEILTHVGPTEFTPSANDRIVRANNRRGFERQARMEARPFILARDGEYVIITNPVTDIPDDEPESATVTLSPDEGVPGDSVIVFVESEPGQLADVERLVA